MTECLDIVLRRALAENHDTEAEEDQTNAGGVGYRSGGPNLYQLGETGQRPDAVESIPSSWP